jgi:hypothetical protein
MHHNYVKRGIIMTSNFELAPSPREYAERILAQSQTVLKEAVAIAFPDYPDMDPQLAFPAPNELRADSPDLPSLTNERREALLAKAGELGFGRPENVTLSEQGLTGAIAIVEGGQPHKMLAEARLIVDDELAHPKMIIISASPFRKIEKEDEKASALRLFGRVSEVEYGFGVDVARALPGFIEHPEAKIMAASYDIENNFEVSNKQSGHFKIVGEVNDAPVVLMQINRRNYIDEAGKSKWDKQPRTAEVINIIHEVAKLHVDETVPRFRCSNCGFVS